jgi:hypothetical protein
MTLQLTKKLPYNKGNSQQCEETTWRTGENIYKPFTWQIINIQNMQRIQTQLQKNNNLILKKTNDLHKQLSKKDRWMANHENMVSHH